MKRLIEEHLITLTASSTAIAKTIERDSEGELALGVDEDTIKSTLDIFDLIASAANEVRSAYRLMQIERLSATFFRLNEGEFEIANDVNISDKRFICGMDASLDRLETFGHSLAENEHARIAMMIDDPLLTNTAVTYFDPEGYIGYTENPETLAQEIGDWFGEEIAKLKDSDPNQTESQDD
ncbi:hypothetical protein C6499_19070 [Candidatus Poribacteria bacterium]|nr:MAG: hypothetical protein C6499_19070 [Candidatus Poribacteria bacterium]